MDAENHLHASATVIVVIAKRRISAVINFLSISQILVEVVVVTVVVVTVVVVADVEVDAEEMHRYSTLQIDHREALTGARRRDGCSFRLQR